MKDDGRRTACHRGVTLGLAGLVVMVIAVSGIAAVAETLTTSARLRGLIELGLVFVIFGEAALWVRLDRWVRHRRRAERPPGETGTRWRERA
jgi:hypothetical protein